MVLLQIEHLGLKFVSITIHSFTVCRGNWVICWKLFNITLVSLSNHGSYYLHCRWLSKRWNLNLFKVEQKYTLNSTPSTLIMYYFFKKYFVEFGYSKAAWSNLFAITVTNNASYKTTISETFRLLHIYTSGSLYKVRNFQSKLFHFLMGKQKEERYK